MGYLLDALDPLANQQDVVRNERRQTTENRPYGVVDGAVRRKASEGRSGRRSARTPTSRRRLADVRDFFKRYYRPNNATLVIAGDFDGERKPAGEILDRSSVAPTCPSPRSPRRRSRASGG
jgi:zinc protease